MGLLDNFGKNVEKNVDNKIKETKEEVKKKQESEYEEYTVVSGDSLSLIAKKVLGDSSKYMQIFEDNKNVWEENGVTPNPDNIQVGWVFKIKK